MGLANTALPFAPNSILRTELRETYLVNAIQWLTDASLNNQKTLRAVVSDNPWETAYSITAILRSRKQLKDISRYRDDYDSRIEHATEYLLSFVVGSDSYVSWDRNPYDTGLAVQALIYFQRNFPASQIANRIASDFTIRRSIDWIIDYARRWMGDQTIGEIDDISVCIRAVISAKKSSSNKLNYLNESEPVVHGVIKELLANAIEDNSVLHWGDIYSSAYILIMLQDYLEVFTDSELKADVEKAIRFGLNFLEQSFKGNWEQPPDTALALHCYLRSGSHSLLQHDVLPEIIYLCLRWLCDDKQCYRNGSIQRSIHYTALFVEVIAFACSYPELEPRVMDNNIAHVNDFVLRQIIQRDTIDRSKISLLKIQIVHLEKELNNNATMIKQHAYSYII